jgi:hypothetical protein
VAENDPYTRVRVESILGPLFVGYRVLEFRGGTVFRGPISFYCEAHRAEVERGLRHLPGGYCFERMDGTAYLTYTLPAPTFRPTNASLHLSLFLATVLTTLLAGASLRQPPADAEEGPDNLPGNYCFHEGSMPREARGLLPGMALQPIGKLSPLGLSIQGGLSGPVAEASSLPCGLLEELGFNLRWARGSGSLAEAFRRLFVLGGPFSLAILLILGSHELGHYVMARRYGMLVTPPFFLPAPIPPIGTFGAVIKMRSPMLHRRALLDIGLAGPLAGLAVAFPFLIYGILHSRFEMIRYWEKDGNLYFGNSVLTWGLTRLLAGPPPTGYMLDWLSHPFAWAGWIGLLVTSLNLIPVGQLDGGHVAYALVGRRQHLVAYFVVGMLLALAHRWPGWMLWCVIMVTVMRLAHPPVAIEDVALGPGRRALGWLALLLFLLLFMPAPVSGVF